MGFPCLTNVKVSVGKSEGLQDLFNTLVPSLLIYFLQVIAAEGEMNASRALKEAAEIISELPSSLQLRYLQTP